MAACTTDGRASSRQTPRGETRQNRGGRRSVGAPVAAAHYRKIHRAAGSTYLSAENLHTVPRRRGTRNGVDGVVQLFREPRGIVERGGGSYLHAVQNAG